MAEEDYYPPEDVLRFIRDTKVDDFHRFMSYIQRHWNFQEWGWRKDGEVYRISTGGWSGNEELIGAMQDNTLFWVMYWQQSKRGGHYIFCPIGSYDV